MSAFVVGQRAVLVAGIEGEVTGLGADWVEIEGHRLPRRLVPGVVRYLSLDYPTYADDLKAEVRGAQDDLERAENRWLTLVQENHRDCHTDAWLLCRDRLCIEAKSQLMVGAS